MSRQEDIKGKRCLVERTLLKHNDRSTNWIAQVCGVSWLFVDKVRATMDLVSPEQLLGRDCIRRPRSMKGRKCG